MMSSQELTRFLFSLAALLLAAHLGGKLFARARLPKVIGELCGGLLLGPTLTPEAFRAALFGSSGPSLSLLYNLGLLLLMFLSGAEMRSSLQAGERRAIAGVTLAGTGLPLLLGAFLAPGLTPLAWRGAEATDLSYATVLGVAFAVTSIPVISRIMLDLGILDTAFARIVLGAAVIEDLLLYLVLAVALPAGSDSWGLNSWLGANLGPTGAAATHGVIVVSFFVLALTVGTSLLRRLPELWVGGQWIILLLFAGTAQLLGIQPFLGTFVAGVLVGRAGWSQASMRDFGLSFLVPVYFALVGFRLDLVRDFAPLAFLALLLVACAVKSLSVYAGARWGGESNRGALNLAIAMNARGGPGIVLASVAFDAGVISVPCYTILVMLSVVTSLLAGSWLEREVAAGRPLR